MNHVVPQFSIPRNQFENSKLTPIKPEFQSLRISVSLYCNRNVRLWKHTSCCYDTYVINLTSEPDVSPSSNPDVSASFENAAGCCQANRTDEIGEGDSGGKLQQAHVIVERIIVVAWVTDDPGYGSGHLVDVNGLLSQPAQVDHQV